MEVRQEIQVSGEGEIIPDYLGPWMSGFAPKLGFLLLEIYIRHISPM